VAIATNASWRNGQLLHFISTSPIANYPCTLPKSDGTQSIFTQRELCFLEICTTLAAAVCPDPAKAPGRGGNHEPGQLNLCHSIRQQHHPPRRPGAGQAGLPSPHCPCWPPRTLPSTRQVRRLLRRRRLHHLCWCTARRARGTQRPSGRRHSGWHPRLPGCTLGCLCRLCMATHGRPASSALSGPGSLGPTS
jgi:hypothetical protein